MAAAALAVAQQVQQAQQAQQGGRTAPNGQPWIYRVDPVAGIEQPLTALPDEDVMRRNAARNERLINQRASEGWELTAVGGASFYFRRPR